MNEVALRLAARIFDQALIQNQYRSAFVEAMIEPCLQPAGWRYTGDGWSGWDFERSSDSARLELKQSAARQTWSEARQQQEPTGGIYDIASRAGYFYENGAKYAAGPGRAAEVYVFAWHRVFGPHADDPDQPPTDHRDPDQWEFYVVPATLLPRGQKKIALSKIQLVAAPNSIDELRDQVELVLRSNTPPTSRARIEFEGVCQPSMRT
jgi:hypothetical protein